MSLELKALPDDELLQRLAEAVGLFRHVDADLVDGIGEVDRRRLCLRQACPSMYVYCVQRLHLSESEAYLRIGVARAAREHPLLLEVLRDGRIHVAGLHLLLPHLAQDDREALLQGATHKSRKEIELLVAGLSPRPDAPSTMRKLPQRSPALQPATDARDGAGSTLAAEPLWSPGPGGASTAPPQPFAALPPSPSASPPPASTPRPATVEPLTAARYLVKFTASAELHAKLERLKALMRNSVPDSDLGAIIEEAVTEKLERLESRRFALTSAPRKDLADTDTSATSRYIPAAVRRSVYERDGGRCRYVDEQGRRCPERDDLEYHHHARPFGRGGDHRPEGIRLLCRPHNALLAEQEYGRHKMAQYRAGG